MYSETKLNNFLINNFNAVEIHQVLFNDVKEHGKCGAAAHFTLYPNKIAELLTIYQPELIDTYHEIDNFMRTKMQEIKDKNLHTPLTDYIADFYPDDVYYWEVYANNDEYIFTQHGIQCATPQDIYLVENNDIYQKYQNLRKILSEMFFEIFKLWYQYEKSEKETLEKQGQAEYIQELRKKLFRDNVFEQTIINSFLDV